MYWCHAPVFKNKGGVQCCSPLQRRKLISHSMKLWETIIEARPRDKVKICEQQVGFIPRKSSTDALFAMRVLMKKYREGQKEMHCVFVDLEKAYDRVPRQELWYCMRNYGADEKYVRIVQDMYENSVPAVRCPAGLTDSFKVKSDIASRICPEPIFVFAMVMDRFTDDIRQEFPRGL